MYSILKWLIIIAIPMMIFRWITKAAIIRGTRVNLYVSLIAAAGSTAIVSAACAASSVMIVGPIGLVLWIGAALFLAFWYTQKPHHEREEWLRMEMRFFDAMTTGGIVVGALGAGFAFLKLHLIYG